MSISPPSDIVLDVARAADPARINEATARLGRATPADGTDFATVLSSSLPPTPSPTKPAALTSLPRTTIPASAAKAFQSFEAMTLSTMIEAAMPDSEAVFGSGEAGGVWKSMLAEQIAGEMAKGGGIGIAAQLAASRALTSASPGADGVTTGGDTSSLRAGSINLAPVGLSGDSATD